MKVYLCDFPQCVLKYELHPVEVSWTRGINQDDTVTCKLDTNDSTWKADQVANLLSVGKSLLLVEDEGLTIAGIIWSISYDMQGHSVSVEGKGLWSLFARRILIRGLRDDEKIINPDHTPKHEYDTNLRNMSYQGIVNAWVRQANEAAPASQRIPIAYNQAPAGTFERNIKATELKRVGDMLTNLTDVKDGCDIAFSPRIFNHQRVEFVVDCGNPRIGASRGIKWDSTLPETPVDKITVDISGDNLASTVWASGSLEGDNVPADAVLLERVVTHSLEAAGYPMLEDTVSLSTSVSTDATALNHALERIRTATQPMLVYGFNIVRRPSLGVEWNIGDTVGLKIENDPIVANGWRSLRVMSMSGSSTSAFISVKTGAIYG